MLGVSLLVGLVALPLAAQNTSAPVPRQFLIVVDTSFSMSRLAAPVRLAVSNLVGSGLQGQLSPGDLFGLWAFNEHVYQHEFQPLSWDPVLNQAMAKGAARFVKAQKWEKSTRLDVLLPDLFRAARAAPYLTVILLSDGDEFFHGLPFDLQLNTIYRQNYRQLRRAKMPFVTTLVAVQGSFVAFSVNAANQIIAFDDLARQIADTSRVVITPAISPATSPVVAQPPTPNTNAAPTRPAQPPPATPTLESRPLVQATNAALPKSPLSEPVARTNPPTRLEKTALEQTVGPAPAKTVFAPPPSPTRRESNALWAKPTAVVAMAPPVESLQVGSDPARIVPADSPRPASSIETRQAAEPGLSEAALKSQPTQPASAGATPMSVPAPNPPPPSTAVAQPLLEGNRNLVLSLILFAAGVTLCLWFLLRRRPPHQPSFISQSIDRES